MSCSAAFREQQLLRLVDARHLAQIRLPGGRDRRGYGTGEPSRRVFYSVDEIRRLIARSSEHQAPPGQRCDDADQAACVKAVAPFASR